MVLNGIAKTGIEAIVIVRIEIVSIAVAAKAPRAIMARLTTARRSTVLVFMAMRIADRHMLVPRDINRVLAAHIVAAPALAIVVVDARTKAILVTTMLLGGPLIAVAKCTAAHKIIAVQNNMPRATILEAGAALALVLGIAPVRVPASSAAADPLLPPGVSMALVGAAPALAASVPTHSDPVASDLLALVAEVSALHHLAAVDSAEASDPVDLEAASAARPQ